MTRRAFVSLAAAFVCTVATLWAAEPIEVTPLVSESRVLASFSTPTSFTEDVHGQNGTTVVDASIVVRLLQSRRDDAELRERFGRQRHVHAPTLIDAEVTSAIRGLLLTTKPTIQITVERAEQMLETSVHAAPLVRLSFQIRAKCTVR